MGVDVGVNVYMVDVLNYVFKKRVLVILFLLNSVCIN